MDSLKRIAFFTGQYQKQLQKKWKSLPLLLLFPILIIGLCFYVLVSFLLPAEDKPIEVGLVDLDKSEETTMLVDVIDNSSLLGSYIHINHLTNQEADHALEKGKLSSYILFPENFTNDLYSGNPVNIPIVGNPNQPVESYIIKELIDSMTRYIASAQASILTINEYAKQLPIESEQRQEMLLDQFNQFMIFTLSAKGKIFHEKEIANLTTTSPVQYYSLSGWFLLVTIWILGIYILLGNEEKASMWNRMRLYGVTKLQRMISRIIISLAYGCLLALTGFYLFIKFTNIEFYLIDYGRISIIVGLYSLTFLLGLAIIDSAVPSKKLSLLMHFTFTGLILFISGAIVPSIYFPEKAQTALPYLFSTQAFDWLTQVAIEGRMFVEYGPLAVSALGGILLLVAFSTWKERTQG
ncbi:ABC transporter permease [Sediminibacillus albus]|uniref:ABC-2 type transport system permease protein n=1 Tax=Sediminibacillus albus TaxID=407036 RepID=A0A1G8Y3J2_9BACI|nr:ABC transporter permease [Sediminibacillus albus]SDJ97408.1 ABC-2 type transport system permease protein [Sediminibacillus albus]